jgi:hypothetical protein
VPDTIKPNEDWLNRKWRPAMGWMYMTICIFDFIIFPIGWAVFQSYVNQKVEAWDPMTLQGAGLFHMAMGAVLGIAAWSRGQEKMYGSNTHYDTRHDSYNHKYDNRRLKRPADSYDPEI